MSIIFKTDVEELIEVNKEPPTVPKHDLVLFDDDVNTFDFVMDALVKVCKHDSVQAEQCTYIVHFSGKCTVKRGEMGRLKSMCSALLDRGLTAEIQ
jgi:ATP-dependent Clp protease adaptor protein ClpS